ncbi:efflux RND transporter periplasmic adaptor subunit [Paracoccus mangrovi]|jgi:RND family efflux transporter MFP subunit|uniref:Efflux RND transporter periplasmic adaptor subunit n=1 Tax=Paracoccus mangrovi TaxID=1715645 RepID=A0ABV7R3B9_9RHOB
MIRMLVIASIVIAALTGIAVVLKWPWQAPVGTETLPPRPVASIIVTDQPPVVQSTPGVIAARIEVALGFQTLGRVTARNVDIGAVVRQGDVLATLNPDDLQGDVRTAQAAVEATQVELRTAQATAERTRALARRNVASTAQLEQAERALATAHAAVQQALSELIRARDAEGFADMKAPFDGVISAVYVNAGAVVSAGEPVIKLSAEEGLEAVIDLPEAALPRVRIGDRYEVWSEYDETDLQAATISQIEPVADAATRTRRIHLAMVNDNSFRLGALIRARPARSRVERWISVPQSAIVRPGDKQKIWIVTRDGAEGTVALRDITAAGPALNGWVVVTSGLASGDEVIIRGIHSLKEGQRVGQSVVP